jgi:hypothetical protein
MVDYCANPQCVKPLHYLREGTIYIFEIVAPDAGNGLRKGHRLEHYWLCGECSGQHKLERTPEKEVRLISKQSLRYGRRRVEIAERLLAS